MDDIEQVRADVKTLLNQAAYNFTQDDLNKVIDSVVKGPTQSNVFELLADAEEQGEYLKALAIRITFNRLENG